MPHRRTMSCTRPFCRFGTIGLVACFIVGCCQISALADGGTVRISQTKGDYQITALTAPNPFRAGPVDVSVLVQDAATGGALPDAKVTLRIAPRERPSEMHQYRATTSAATNKLFHSAVFDLPASGQWTVEIEIDGPHGPARASFNAEAADRLPRWLSMWPWFSWPFLAVLVFAVHQAFAVNRTPSRPTLVPRRFPQPRHE
jgi:hypothetical protein